MGKMGSEPDPISHGPAVAPTIGGPQKLSVEIVHGHPSTVLTLLVALAAVLVLAVVGTCLVYRKRKRGTRKRVVDTRPLTLRRPTAVRNPSSHSHYLKKSPSPTGSKSPPGVPERSPTGSVSPGGDISKKISPGGLSGSSATTPKTASPVDEKRSKASDSPHNTASDVISYENEKKKTSPEIIELNSKNKTPEVGDKLGKLFFKLRYKADNGALVVTVIKCSDLSQADGSGQSSDPYVKLQLLPDKQHKAKTRVLRNTLNPVYEEDFTFYGISPSHLKELTLHFVVLSFDRYSRDEIIGEVVSPLAQIDLKEPVTLSRQINPRSLKGRGELLLSLCHQPAANRLTVVVLKARNLPKMDITGLSDPYVKIYLLYNGQRVTKKKTHVKKRTVNPVFNESFVFDLPAGAEDLSSVSLECLLLDWDRVTKNEVIGRLELGGPKSVGSAKHHWEEVVSSPRRQIAEWHKLREASK